MLKKENLELKEKIKKEYELKDTLTSELERGLRKAVINNHSNRIEYFFKVDVNINAVNPQKKTALHFAIEREKDNCVKELVPARKP